jgi:hypothetical protein
MVSNGAGVIAPAPNAKHARLPALRSGDFPRSPLVAGTQLPRCGTHKRLSLRVRNKKRHGGIRRSCLRFAPAKSVRLPPHKGPGEQLRSLRRNVQVLKPSVGPLVMTPMSSSVEAAVTWLRAGCHLETASEMIFAVSEVIWLRFV